MGRPPLSIDIAPKDQKELTKLLSGGVQQVRVVLRAVALLQLAKGLSAPQIAKVVPLTSQAIRNILPIATMKVGWSGRCTKGRDLVPPKCSTLVRNSV